jgi:hypothetical protein
MPLLRCRMANFSSIPQSGKKRPALGQLLFLIAVLLLNPSTGFSFLGLNGFNPEVSGEVKTLNFFTLTTGLTPELAENPMAMAERGESVFRNMERARLKIRAPYKIDDHRSFNIKIDYDHQAEFGSFVATGDHRVAEKWTEDRQFLDLSQNFVEEDSARYFHRLYRASITYRDENMTLEVGRQQIPWGRGHFFTPTDIFNPFSPTQVELEERDGVDAVNLTTAKWKSFKGQLVYTPRGRRLHPQRIMGRISRDFSVYEVGILGGRLGADHLAGLDMEGNLGDAVLRGEGIFQESDVRDNFFKYTLNLDYNLPKNFLVGVEYHYNGDGRREPKDYELGRFVKGEIQQMGKNYGAFLVQHDVTPLWTAANRFMMNMDDTSFFVRPEVQYEATNNLLLGAAAQLYIGTNNEEFGRGQNLYLLEMKYSF